MTAEAAQLGTYTRTIRVPVVTLTAKKAGMLNRAMKDYRRAREIACEYFQHNDALEFTYSGREDLREIISSNDRVTLQSRTIYPAITTVEQNYREYEKDARASPPDANHADTIALEGQTARIFYTDGKYYLNVATGKGDVNLPLRASDEEYHTGVLPNADAVPPTGRTRTGVPFADLKPDDFPNDVVKLSTSTLKKRGERQYVANLVFQFAKQISRPDTEPRYIVGVDRGRRQLAYGALYDVENGQVTDWMNVSGDEVRHYLDRFDERIREFQKANVWEKMEGARKRRYRYKKQIDYQIANEVVNLARGAFNVAIAIEGLSDMSRLGRYSLENRRFNEWSYYRQEQYIREKAEPYDIPVLEVDAAYTSQQCSRCGGRENISRRGVHFSCDGCGYQQHADANAAVNIAKSAV